MSNEVKAPLPLKKIDAPTLGSKNVVIPNPVVAATPYRKAFSIERAAGGWCFVTVTYHDDGRIISVDKTQPDLKAIVLEKFKIAAHKHWTTIG